MTLGWGIVGSVGIVEGLKVGEPGTPAATMPKAYKGVSIRMISCMYRSVRNSFISKDSCENKGRGRQSPLYFKLFQDYNGY